MFADVGSSCWSWYDGELRVLLNSAHEHFHGTCRVVDS
jgi:hypothetical protein